MINVFELYYPDDWDAPLVYDSPHSGTRLPFGMSTKLPKIELAKWEDVYVDELYRDAPNFGAPFLAANYHRTFVDLNRHKFDLDPALQEPNSELRLLPQDYTLESGNGLLKRFGPNGEQMVEGTLSDTQIVQLLATYYHSYHGALHDLLEQARNKFGVVYHINCHSMFSTTQEGMNKYSNDGSKRADFVLSDRDGLTCSLELRDFVEETSKKLGYTVAINDPFKGGEMVDMYGDPKRNVHSLQIEMKKSLYTNEETFERHDGFAKTQQNLNKLMEELAVWSKKQIPHQFEEPKEENFFFKLFKR